MTLGFAASSAFGGPCAYAVLPERLCSAWVKLSVASIPTVLCSPNAEGAAHGPETIYMVGMGGITDNRDTRPPVRPPSAEVRAR